MLSTVLSQAGAFNPGSNLWILPDLKNSRWTEQIDWYLNFQITRASRHNTANLAPYLNEVIHETGLQKYSLENSTSDALLIPSINLLPNSWTVILPWHENIHEWISKCYEIWRGLNRPSLRIFLPPGQSAGVFQSAQKADSSFQDFTIVLD